MDAGFVVVVGLGVAAGLVVGEVVEVGFTVGRGVGVVDSDV